MTTEVSIIYSIPSPYQEGLFETVAASPEIKLHVYYTTQTHEEHDWEFDMGQYSNQFMPRLDLPGNATFNPSVVSPIINSDVAVVAGYGILTMQLGIIIAKLSNTPLILWSENHLDDWNSKPPTRLNLIRDELSRKLIKMCDAFFVPGTKQEKYLLHYGADEQRIFAPSHACDVEYFSPDGNVNTDQIKTQFGITEGKILLYVGRLVEKKGINELLRAFNIVENSSDNIALVLAGSGEFESEMHKCIERLGIESVYPLGFTSRHKLPQLYTISDLFVFPSRGDPWGVVINEALASGLPIVTTDRVGAEGDLVIDGINGRIVPSNNVTALANAMRELLESDQLVAMGLRSRQISEYWTHDEAATALQNAIRSVVK